MVDTTVWRKRIAEEYVYGEGFEPAELLTLVDEVERLQRFEAAVNGWIVQQEAEWREAPEDNEALYYHQQAAKELKCALKPTAAP